MGSMIAILSLFLFSFNVLLTKAASSKINVDLGYLISIWMNVVVGLLLVLGEHILWHKGFIWNWRGFFEFVAAGGLTTFLGRLTYFFAIDKLGAGRASTMQVASPVVTVVLAWFLLGEALSPLQTVGCVCSISGLLIISARSGALRQRSSGEAAMGEVKPVVSNGIWFAVASLAAYGVGNLFRGDAVHNWNDPIFGGFIGALVGLFAYASTHKWSLFRMSEVRQADRRAVLMYSMGGLCTILAQISVLFAMDYLPTGIVTIVSMSQPLLVVPLGHFLLRNTEQFTWRTLMGSSLTLAGLILAVGL